MLTFRHSGKMGDIIYSLPSVKKLGGGLFCVDAFRRFRHLPSFGLGKAKFMLPLLKCQSYLDAKLYAGEKIDYDLDSFRDSFQLKTDHLSQCHWNSLGMDGKLDLSEKWLHVTPDHRADIIISRSLMRHGNLDWGILKGYDCAFLGLEREWNIFRKILDIPILEIRNAKEFAQVIAGAKLFVGNQSFGFAVAEALKICRVLEVTRGEFKNAMPQSKNAATELSKELVEGFLRRSS